MLKLLLIVLIVLPRFGLASAVECQGYNKISKDRFYYDNDIGFTLIFERYYAWITLIDNNRRYKDKDKDKDIDKGKRRNYCRYCTKGSFAKLVNPGGHGRLNRKPGGLLNRLNRLNRTQNFS